MEAIYSVLMILLGVVLRVALPIALTILAASLLHKLDARWQAEAELELETQAKDEMPCWKDLGLPIEQIKLRTTVTDQPCWQTHRTANGRLRETCLSCEVFFDAPVPASTSHVHIEIQ
jgi:hypothetical protein